MPRKTDVGGVGIPRPQPGSNKPEPDRWPTIGKLTRRQKVAHNNELRRMQRRARRAERRGQTMPVEMPISGGSFPLEGGGSKQAEGQRRQPPVHRY